MFKESCVIRCQAAPKAVINSISSFLASQGYSISTKEIGRNEFSLSAAANVMTFRKLLKKPIPRLIDVTVCADSGSTCTKFHFSLFRSLRLYAHVMTTCTLGITLLAFLSANSCASAKTSFTLWFIGVFVASCFLALYTIFKSFDLLKITGIVGSIREAIEKNTGSATYLHGRVMGIADIVVPITIFGCLIATIACDAGAWCLLVVLCLPLILLIAIVYQYASKLTRFFVGMVGFQVGLGFCIYSTIPFWYPIYIKPIIEVMVFSLSQDMTLPESVRQSLPLIRHHIEHVPPPFIVMLFLVLGTLVVAVGIVGLFVLIFKRPPADVVKSVNSQRTRLGRASDVVSSTEKTFTAWFQTIAWMVLAPVNIVGAYLALSTLEGVLLGHHWIFPGAIADGFRECMMVVFTFIFHKGTSLWLATILSQGVVIIYCAPIVCLIILVLVKTTRRIVADVILFKDNRLNSRDVPADVLSCVRDISNYAGIQTPYIRIMPSVGLYASATVLIIPFRRTVLTVSSGSMKLLGPMELACLLAHEISHTKQKRSRQFQILNLLSQLSFFGNGWLLGGFDWFAAEYEADAFALAWSKKMLGDEKGRAVMTNLFSQLQQQEVIQALSLLNSGQDAGFLSVEAAWLPDRIRREVSLYSKIGLWRRVRARAAVYYLMFFGDTILTYCHPSIDQRMARVAAS